MKSKIFTLLFILSLLSVSSAQSFFKQAESEKIDDKPDRDLFWGTYKPNRLSAISQKSRSPLTIGYAYSSDIPIGASYNGFEKNFRNSVSNGHAKAYYTAHDGTNYNQQRILDQDLNLAVDVTFFKTKPDEIIQQSWVYIVEPKLKSKSDSEKIFNSYLYISGETLDSRAQNIFEVVEKSANSYRLLAYDALTSTLKGYFDIEFIPNKPISDSLVPEDPDLTEEQIAYYREMWRIQNPGVKVEDENSNKKPAVSICYMDIPVRQVWRYSKHIFNSLVDDKEAGIMVFNEKECSAKEKGFNLAVLQVRGYPRYKIKVTHQSVTKPVNISPASIAMNQKYYSDLLDAKLDKLFPLENLPTAEATQLGKDVRKAALSNLLGGISYTHGYVKTPGDVPKSVLESLDILASTPSRKDYPKGHLWDEGFHLLVICRWDRILCMEILRTWFGTMTAPGWIPREQARGEELESLASDPKTLIQYELEANPPTLLLGLGVLMSGLTRDDPDFNTVLEFLNSGIEGKIMRWFKYFNTTQRNLQVDNDHNFRGPLFKWACIEPCQGKNLIGSGFEDYPRTNGLDEPLANLDLQVWMISMVKIINSIARFKQVMPKPSNVELEKQLIAALEEFYDHKTDLYRDLTQNPMGTEYGTREKKFSDHLGYVNLFPMFFGVVPKKSPAISKLIKELRNSETLWSPFGIRSLSATDSFYLKGEKYATEPVWININYMILRALKVYYIDEPGAKELYTKLRENVINTVTKSWSETGTFWETYSSSTGQGQLGEGYTGWTSLIVLILSESY